MNRALLCGIAFVFLLAVACVLSFTVWRSELQKEIDTRISAIKERGLPTNWEDLEGWPVIVRDENNAALTLTNALGRLVEESEATYAPELDLPPRGDSVPGKTREAIVAWVRTNLAVLETVHGVTNAGSSRYPINYLDGPNALLPHLKKLKTLSRLLAGEALLKAEEKDSAGAARSVESSLKLSRSLDNEPIMISQLVSIAILAISSQSLERVLCRTKLSDEQLLRLSRDFRGAEATNRLVLALIGERASGNELIRLAQDDVRQMITIANKGTSEEERTEMPARNPGVGWRFLGFFARDRNFFLRAMEANILVLSTMPPQSLSLTNELSKIETDASKGYYIMSSLLLPALSRLPIRDAGTKAQLRTAIASMAIERWRLAHRGRTPDTLDELVPAFLPSVPIDPFDGKPLRFKNITNGYVVYSIGMNLQDDDGKERPPKSVKVPREQRNQFDITFTVERQQPKLP